LNDSIVYRLQKSNREADGLRWRPGDLPERRKKDQKQIMNRYFQTTELTRIMPSVDGWSTHTGLSYSCSSLRRNIFDI